MKTTKRAITDFASYLQRFFTEYLPGERMVSKHTVRAYRDTFVLFVEFMHSTQKISPDKIKLQNFTRDMVVSFLNWLIEVKHCSTSTYTSRYAAIRSFCEYLQYKEPSNLAQWQDIRAIKTKRPIRNSVEYLTMSGIKVLLGQIPTDNKVGRRDLAILSLLYESAARVQELVNLTPSSLRLESPAIVQLYGKGNKRRIVPLNPHIADLLSVYMEDYGIDTEYCRERPLFFNCWGTKLTTSGITYILQKYANLARIRHPTDIPPKISPHCLRHSKAMHLLENGVNLIYIRDILGHTSIQTTEIYARIDSKHKREAIEKASIRISPLDLEKPIWEKDEQLKSFLKSLA